MPARIRTVNGDATVGAPLAAPAVFLLTYNRFSSGPYVVLQRYVQILRFAQDDNVAYRVILSAAKDLYEMCTNNILNLSSYVGPMTMNLEL